jgi:hypothetical protein
MQVYVIDTVLIPQDDLADIPQTIPAGKQILDQRLYSCVVAA